MSTNYTENFDLCQWEPTDPVIRTDFNADNAKIDAALAALETARSWLERAASCAAYYAGWLAMTNQIDQGRQLPQRSMVCEDFRDTSLLTCTGGAVIQNNTLVLNGAGQTGTMTAGNMAVYRPNWTRAVLWLHHLSGDVDVAINGEEMELVDNGFANAVNGTRCFEMEYVWEGTGSSPVQIKLTLNTGTATSMTVYDYFVMLF